MRLPSAAIVSVPTATSKEGFVGDKGPTAVTPAGLLLCRDRRRFPASGPHPVRRH